MRAFRMPVRAMKKLLALTVAMVVAYMALKVYYSMQTSSFAPSPPDSQSLHQQALRSAVNKTQTLPSLERVGARIGSSRSNNKTTKKDSGNEGKEPKPKPTKDKEKPTPVPGKGYGKGRNNPKPHPKPKPVKNQKGVARKVLPAKPRPLLPRLLLLAKQLRNKYAWNTSETSRDPEEVRHVIFVKVHKAASSTLQNIFLRFSVSRQLNILFPSLKDNILSIYTTALRPLLPHPPSPPFLFDLLINHVVFNHSVISPFFPPDTRHVAIIREPWSLVQSSFFYFKKVDPMPYLKNCNFGRYIQDQRAFERVFPLKSFTNNRMSLDMGLPPGQLSNSSFIPEFLRQMDSIFDIVLVAERLDESLVLMKRLFRWTFKDILYARLNAHKHPQTNGVQDEQVLQRFRQFEQFDVALYDHFVNVLNQKIAEQTKDFVEEVEAFVRINEDVSSFCGQQHNRSVWLVPQSPWSGEFTISSEECAIMVGKELDVNKWAQLQQLARLTPLISG